MNVKRFAIACIAVKVINQVLGFPILQFVLGDVCKIVESGWRPEARMMSLMWIRFLTSAVFAALFCSIVTAAPKAKGPVMGYDTVC